MNSKIKNIIVAHDAGGAEVVAAFAKKHWSKDSFVAFADGPAKLVFARYNIISLDAPTDKDKIEEIFKNYPDAKFLLTGTSIPSTLELDFIKTAKSLGVVSASYLEHWVGYRERFGYPKEDWQKNLPDEIWTGDEYAYKIAESDFPNKKVKLVPNEYWILMQEEFKKLIPNTNKDILFLSDNLPYSEILLQDLLSLLSVKKWSYKIILRLHPAESKDKYDLLINKYIGNLEIIKSANTLIKDIACADTIIGSQTMALVISSLCGKRTLSIIPKEFGLCSLPQKEIIHLNSVEEMLLWLPNNSF